jgi:hypothetical protein
MMDTRRPSKRFFVQTEPSQGSKAGRCLFRADVRDDPRSWRGQVEDM